jgi:hypothetical protein
MSHLSRYLHSRGIVAFPDSVVLTQTVDRLDAIIQAYSIGSLRPNTIMLSVPPPTQAERRERLAAMLETVASFGVNVVVYKGAKMQEVGKRRIDVWWHGERNGSLLTLFAYLVSEQEVWSQVRIRMLRVVTSGAEHLEAERSLSEIMQAARLAVDVEVILSQRPVSELIVERSGSADLVLLGLRQQDVVDFRTFLAQRDGMLARLPPTLLVLSNGEADLLA